MEEDKDIMEFENTMLHNMYPDFEEILESGDDICGEEIFRE